MWRARSGHVTLIMCPSPVQRRHHDSEKNAYWQQPPQPPQPVVRTVCSVASNTPMTYGLHDIPRPIVVDAKLLFFDLPWGVDRKHGINIPAYPKTGFLDNVDRI